MESRIAAIVNPHAAGGRAGRLWPRLVRPLRDRLGELAVHITDSAGDATRFARELIMRGFEFIIAVGGDGTISEVANGFLRDDWPISPRARLGILPVGTGADFQRTLAIPSDAFAAIDVLATGRALPIDVGKVRFVDVGGRERQRYFVNLTSFGISGAIAVRAKNSLQALGGRATFLWATLKTAATDHGRAIEIRLDESADWHPHFITNVAIGNGRFHGGGMCPCPKAELDDGLLDVTIIQHLKPLEIVRDIRVLYSDNVYVHPKVGHLRARRIAARSSEPTWIEVDGEPLGRLPIEVEVLPRRLQVIVPECATPRSG
jgi:diacylglycerol kinase (ATP)